MSKCVSCGIEIPEGSQVCYACMHGSEPIFTDILQANTYCKFRGWESYWIKRDDRGYTVHELKGD